MSNETASTPAQKVVGQYQYRKTDSDSWIDCFSLQQVEEKAEAGFQIGVVGPDRVVFPLATKSPAQLLAESLAREAVLQEELASERTLRRNHASRIHELSDQAKDVQQRLPAAPVVERQPVGVSEDVIRFGIEVEKALCAAVGREWAATGISIETLIEQLKQKSAPVAVVLAEVRSLLATTNYSASRDCHNAKVIGAACDLIDKAKELNQ